MVSATTVDAAEMLKPLPRVWWMVLVTILVATCGFVCKFVDQENGEKRLRSSNSFAAAYSLLMFLFSFQWLVLDMSGGTLEGVHATLVSNPWEAFAHHAHEGQQICVFMLAYMVQDVVIRFFFAETDFRYLVHHFSCIVGLILVLFVGLHPIYCVALSISEFSTPVVCLFEVAQMEQGSMNKYIKPCGVLLNLCFPVRVAWFTWTFYLFAFEYRHRTFLELTPENVGFVCVGLLVLVNWSWYIDLLVGTIRTLQEDKPPAKIDKIPDPKVKKAQ